MASWFVARQQHWLMGILLVFNLLNKFFLLTFCVCLLRSDIGCESNCGHTLTTGLSANNQRSSLSFARAFGLSRPVASASLHANQHGHLVLDRGAGSLLLRMYPIDPLDSRGDALFADLQRFYRRVRQFGIWFFQHQGKLSVGGKPVTPTKAEAALVFAHWWRHVLGNGAQQPLVPSEVWWDPTDSPSPVRAFVLWWRNEHKRAQASAEAGKQAQKVVLKIHVGDATMSALQSEASQDNLLQREDLHWSSAEMRSWSLVSHAWRADLPLRRQRQPPFSLASRGDVCCVNDEGQLVCASRGEPTLLETIVQIGPTGATSATAVCAVSPDNRDDDLQADSFFDVFVEVEVPPMPTMSNDQMFPDFPSRNDQVCIFDLYLFSIFQLLQLLTFVSCILLLIGTACFAVRFCVGSAANE